MRHHTSRFIKNWICPPKIFDLIRGKKKLPQLQKFWMGAPVSPSPRDGEYFRRSGLPAAAITRRDDTRTAAPLTGSHTLPVESKLGTDTIEFAFTCDSGNPNAALFVETDLEKVELTGLRKSAWGHTPGRWAEVRLKCSQAMTSLSIQCEEEIFVTRPRRVISSPKTAEISSTAVPSHHVICLVLDGLPAWAFDKDLLLPDGSAVTPNITRYFANGLTSYNGYSSAEWTLPAVASTFSGMLPSEHKMYHPRDNIYHRADIKLLAETMQAEGYQTLCMSAASRINPAFGCHRGFDRFIYHWAEEGMSDLDYQPAEWINELVGFLSSHRFDKTFSYLQFPDTHPAWDFGPLSQSLQLLRRGNRPAWDFTSLARSKNAKDQGMQMLLLRLHEIDRMLGYFFNFIETNLQDKTTVILTSDHGTPWSAFRLKRADDEPTLVDDRISIPLLAKGVGIPKKEISGLISPNIDLYPTIMSASQIESPSHLSGKDLSQTECEREYVVSESAFGKVYEIAVNFRSGVWIEKFNYDDLACKVTGDSFYSYWFEKPNPDYKNKQNTPIPEVSELVKQHMLQTGVRDS